MATCSTANKANGGAFLAQGAAAWLALAAAPTFALMAGMAANDGPAVALCASGSSLAPFHGMAAMCVLMSLFHLSPWLKLACPQH
jgi:hypothetical protein